MAPNCAADVLLRDERVTELAIQRRHEIHVLSHISSLILCSVAVLARRSLKFVACGPAGIVDSLAARRMGRPKNAGWQAELTGITSVCPS